MTKRHNKKRNTAFVYEVLIMELTKATLEKDEELRGKTVSIIKEFFSKGKLLAKELKLYDTVLETVCKDYNIASRLYQNVRRDYESLPKKAIYKEQSRLISKINKSLNPDVFENFVDEYKEMASVYLVFNDKFDAKKKVVLEESILNHMVTQPIKDETEPLDDLTYNIFMEKFNKKYSGELLENQKRVLSYYISSFTDDGLTLNTYLNEELGRLKSTLLITKQIEDDKVMKEGSEKIVKFLNSLKERKINEGDIKKILEIQDFVQDLNSMEDDFDEDEG